MDDLNRPPEGPGKVCLTVELFQEHIADMALRCDVLELMDDNGLPLLQVIDDTDLEALGIPKKRYRDSSSDSDNAPGSKLLHLVLISHIVQFFTNSFSYRSVFLFLSSAFFFSFSCC